MNEFHILSLSGGGYKGLFSVHVLKVLEDELKGPIAKHFDLIAGTSIGGIIALALALETPAERLVQIFTEQSDVIFPQKRLPFQSALSGWLRPRYSNHGLKRILTDLFGNAKIGDLRHRVILPTVNYLEGKPQVLKTRHHSSFKSDWKYRLVDAALATSAAPIYFPAHQFAGKSFLDGGLVANHPGLFALTEAQKYLNQTLESVRQLHIGTLSQNFGSSGHDSTNKNGIVQWNKRLLDVVFSCQEQSTENLLGILLRDRYCSVDNTLGPKQTKFVGLDKTSATAKKILEGLAGSATQQYLASNHFSAIKAHIADEFFQIPS